MGKQEEITAFDVLHNQIKVAEKNPPKYYIELGICLKKMKKTKAYQEDEYQSFPQYRRKATEVSRARANELIAVVEEFDQLLETAEGYLLLNFTGWSKVRELKKNSDKYQPAIEKGLLSLELVVYFGHIESKRPLAKKFDRYEGHDLWSRILIKICCPNEYDEKEDMFKPAKELYGEVARGLYDDISTNLESWHANQIESCAYRAGSEKNVDQAAAVCYELLSIKRGLDVLFHWNDLKTRILGFFLFKYFEVSEFSREGSPIVGESSLSELRYLSNPFYSTPPQRELWDVELSSILSQKEIKKWVEKGYITPTIGKDALGKKEVTYSLDQVRKIVIAKKVEQAGKSLKEAINLAERWLKVEKKVFDEKADYYYFITTSVEGYLQDDSG